MMETVFFDDWDVTEIGCALRAVSWTAPIKKQYLVDVPGTDGSLDMASWFGGPRYEPRTMNIVLEPRGTNINGLWDKLAQELYGRTYNIRTSVDPSHYWRGEVQSIITYSGYPGEVVITALVEPYRYAVIPTVYSLPSSIENQDAVIVNMGTRVEIPKVTVTGDSIRITTADGLVIKMETGIYNVPELAITQRSFLRFQYSGGPGEIVVREAFL